MGGDLDILEYEIECKKALNRYHYELIDDMILEDVMTESSKNRSLTNSEKRSHIVFINKLKRANSKLKKKLGLKKSELSDVKTDKKIRLTSNPKKIKKQIESDTKFFDKISKKASRGEKISDSEIEEYKKRYSQTVLNNGAVILDASVALSDIKAACDAADNMADVFDNAYTSLSNPETTDFRDENTKIADAMAMRSGANIKVLFSALKDANIKK